MLAGTRRGTLYSVAADSERFDDIDTLVVEHAAIVCALEMARAKAISEIEKKLRPAPSELRNLNTVLNFIFEDLDLRYALNPTRSAVQTFHDQRRRNTSATSPSWIT